jgi:hypothetical protein
MVRPKNGSSIGPVSTHVSLETRLQTGFRSPGDAYTIAEPQVMPLTIMPESIFAAKKIFAA